MRKVSRCRTAVPNETILATRQEFFFTKVAPVQSITGIVLLDFWLMLPSWMFVLFYTTIYFFVKKFIFSNVYISVNTIFECLYLFFFVEKGAINLYASIKYLRNWQKDGGHPKYVQLRRGCQDLCVRTHLHYIFSWGIHAYLIHHMS